MTESNQVELEIVDYDGRSTILSNPSIAYPSTFGPSKVKDGIAVRRGVEESVLLWSRIQTLRFKSRQEKNDKGVSIWRHAVEAVLRDGQIIEVELKDDWNMAYMGGGGTGLLFGQRELGENSDSIFKNFHVEGPKIKATCCRWRDFLLSAARPGR